MLKIKSKNRASSLMEKRNMIGYVFIAPFILGLIAIFIPSVVQSLYYSFGKVEIGFDAVTVTLEGVGNYIKAFTEDTQYRVYLLDTVTGIFTDLITIVFFSFFIAFVLNQKFIGRGAARTIFFLPVILATGIIASADLSNSLMSAYSSSSNTGATISNAFSGGGLSSILDLEELLLSANIGSSITDFLLNAINNTYNIVNYSGVQILIFLSALQSISPSLFEAADVEGATKWEEFWKITFPMITPMVLVNIVYTIVDSFTNPKYKILSYVEENAFSNNQLGYASALSWVYFIIVLVIIGVLWKLMSKRINYLD